MAVALALTFCAVPALAAGTHAGAPRSPKSSAGGQHSLLSTALTIAILVTLAAGLVGIYRLARRHERKPARARQRGY
jgi:hypothetical protein